MDFSPKTSEMYRKKWRVKFQVHLYSYQFKAIQIIRDFCTEVFLKRRCFHQTCRWYLKWRNPHLYKLYGYGLLAREFSHHQKIAENKVQETLQFRYLKFLVILLMNGYQVAGTTETILVNGVSFKTDIL